MQELEKKIKDLKEFIKEKTDQGTANYLGKEIREICGMVESEQFSLHVVSHQRELLIAAFERLDRPLLTMIEVGNYEEAVDELLSY